MSGVGRKVGGRAGMGKRCPKAMCGNGFQKEKDPLPGGQKACSMSPVFVPMLKYSRNASNLPSSTDLG